MYIEKWLSQGTKLGKSQRRGRQRKGGRKRECVCVHREREKRTRNVWIIKENNNLLGEEKPRPWAGKFRVEVRVC